MGVIIGPDLILRDGRLLTRGMRGTIIYAVEAETRIFLNELVQLRRGPETVYQ